MLSNGALIGSIVGVENMYCVKVILLSFSVMRNFGLENVHGESNMQVAQRRIEQDQKNIYQTRNQVEA